ncbi:hypothetical protein Dimus_010442 [Dionaea muscipula]
MNDNGLSNVMSLIKKQKWENLFKRRELMHTAACKEFYANLTVFIYKKKEIAKSRVKGVEIEFDSMKLASILDVPGHTAISEYIKKFGRSPNKKGEEPKRFDYFEETFLTMLIDEAVVEEESGSREKFYDADDEVQESLELNEEVPAVATQASTHGRKQDQSRVDPSGSSGRILESVMNKLQAEFERARANRFQADLEKVQAENARLLALLQQA